MKSSTASCQVVNKDEANHRVVPTERTTLAVSEKNLLTPNGSNRGRSKSVALVGRPPVGNYLTVPNQHDYSASKHKHCYEEGDVSPDPLSRLSQHQPCPNHVGGKTFSERGTQTLAKQKGEQSTLVRSSSVEVKKKIHGGKIRRGCLAIRCRSKPREDEMSSETDESASKQPLRHSSKCRGFESSWKRSKVPGDEDVVSVGSGHHHRNSSGLHLKNIQLHLEQIS